MKIRTDFITNSSSSSFVIMSKEKLNKDELKKRLIEALDLKSSSNSLFPNLGEQIAEALTYDITFTDIKGYMDDYGMDDISELKNRRWLKGSRIYDNYKEYPYIMFGSCADDSDNPMEVMLVDVNIDFKNDNIIVVKDGGY